eukprot:1158754-Pelagomonas_calceolata.AAC.3
MEDAHLLAELLDDALGPRPRQAKRTRGVGDVRQVHNHPIQQVPVLPLVDIGHGLHLGVEVLEQLKVDGHVSGQHHVNHQLPALQGREGETGDDREERKHRLACLWAGAWAVCAHSVCVLTNLCARHAAQRPLPVCLPSPCQGALFHCSYCCSSHTCLFLLVEREELEDVAALVRACQLEGPCYVVVLVHGLVVVRGGPRMPTVDEEVVVNAQVPQVVHGRGHDDAEDVHLGDFIDLLGQRSQNDGSSLRHVRGVHVVVVRVGAVACLHPQQKVFHCLPVDLPALLQETHRAEGR